MSTVQEELTKIKSAFERVKADNIYLSNRIDQLERSRDEMLAMIMKNTATAAVAAEKSNTKVSTKNEDEIFIGNATSMKVHVSNCPYAKKINGDNRVIFDNLNDALREKYIRCSCVAN